jgi:hypothetical protein
MMILKVTLFLEWYKSNKRVTSSITHSPQKGLQKRGTNPNSITKNKNNIIKSWETATHKTITTSTAKKILKIK